MDKQASRQLEDVTYTSMADKERGARKRLSKIMSKYPALGYYVQTDPRGASLYILRPGSPKDVRDCYSTHGIAVYK